MGAADALYVGLADHFVPVAQLPALAALMDATPGAQLLAKPRVATQFIVTDHPAVWDLLAPQVEHLQALRLSRVIPHLLGHMTFPAPLRVPDPLLGQV